MVQFGVYQHHGIACGDETVIHFGRGIFDAENAGIELVSIKDFCGGKPIQVVESKLIFANTEVADRARSRIGEKGYDLWDNNCEHFVNWCRSGEPISSQINLTETIARQSAAMAYKPAVKLLAKRFGSKHIGAMARGIGRGPAMVAFAADAFQATAEIVAAKRGKSKDKSQQIGRGFGVASSVAIGWVVGGPATAAAGVGFWMAGQVFAARAVDTGKQMVNTVVRVQAAR